MRVLVLGKGGREHAIVWKLSQSPRIKTLYCAPGNAGTAIDANNVNLDINDFDKVVQFVRREAIDLTIVGPEDPLSKGIVDHFQRHSLKIFGPTKEAAQIEASKVFSKNLMRQADVPTADYVVFDHPEPARNYVKSREYVLTSDGRHLHYPFEGCRIATENGVRLIIEGKQRYKISPPEPMVVKADGLASGKGVFVCSTTEEALTAIERIMVREEFGRAAGRQIIIEKRLDGEEVSLLALVSGKTIIALPPARDHKRALDDDKGPNTGGMGAYCPAPVESLDGSNVLEMADRDIFVPIVHAMRQRGKGFLGILYAGLMLTSQGTKVLEFNCRAGDPETQPLLMRLKTDLLDVIEAAMEDRLESVPMVWDPRVAVCVVMASEGYPGTFTKGHPITGLGRVSQMDDVKVFHAGTRLENDRILTDGGRVLCVTALGDTLEQARERAYAACGAIQFRGAFYRKDIGLKRDRPRTTIEPVDRED